MPSTILIVDDDPGVSDALSIVLTDEGYRVVLAENGSDALAWLRAHPPPDLILLDLMMPVMDGYEFRRAQRLDPALSSIPVLVLTAGAVDVRIAELAVPKALRKPIDIDDLLAELRQHA